MIYSDWAFTENEREKMAENKKEYEALCTKYNIYRNDLRVNPEVNEDKYDIIIGRLPGYNHSEYNIIKNKPNLTLLQLALICDEGNLCFGYTQGHKIKDGIYVFED